MITPGYTRPKPECQGDAACKAPATKIHVAGMGWEGAPTLTTCDAHQIAARKIVGRTTTAIIFTYDLAEAS